MIAISRTIVVALAASVLVSAPALAQSGPPIWTGVYAGVHGGGAWGGNDGEDDDDTVDLSGGLGGINGGYAWQTGRFVFGVEGGVSLGSISGEEHESGVDASFGFPISFAVDLDVALRNLYELRGKLGYAFGPALLHASGGIAWTELNIDQTAVASGGGVTFSDERSGSEVLTGFTVGGGASYRVLSNLSANIDVSYYRFEDDSFEMQESVGSGDSYEVEMEFTVVRGGLTYHFN